MDSIVEIYIKLVIALVSFIAPLIVALLSVFSQGVGLMREKGNVKLKNMTALLQNLTQNNESVNVDEVTRASNQLKIAKKDTVKTSNILNPKRQIYRVFTPLFASLLFIMISKLFQSFETNPKYGYQNNHTWCLFFIIISVASAAWSLYVLKQIAWKVIETKDELNKREIEKENEKNKGAITSNI